MQDKKGYGKQEKKTRWTAAELVRIWLSCSEGRSQSVFMAVPSRFKGHCTTQVYPNENVLLYIEK